MSQMRVRPDVAQVSEELISKPLDLVDRERGTRSGGVSTDLTSEPSLAPPRLIPAPDSPPLSGQLPPEPSAEDKGRPSESFDR